MPKLIMLSAAGETRQIELQPDASTIGRGEASFQNRPAIHRILPDFPTREDLTTVRKSLHGAFALVLPNVSGCTKTVKGTSL